MLRCLAAAFAVAAFLRAPAPQELKTEVLEKLKSATVYVKVEERGRRGSGSGFLFLKVYDTRDFKLQTSHYLGVRAAQAHAAPDGGSILIGGSALGEPTGRRPRHPAGSTTAVVDLYRYEIPR